MSEPEEKSPPPAAQRLAALREALFRLHKTIIDSERTSYEQTFGPISSPNHFLQLLTRDPWFAWLQPLSQLVLDIDEAMDGETPLDVAGVEAMVKRCRALLVATETGEGFPRNYFDALQRDPEVVMAHAQVARFFQPAKPRS